MAYFGRDPYEEWRYQQELDAYYQQQQQAQLAAQAQNQQASGVGETAGELGGAYIAEQAPNWFGFGASSSAPAVSGVGTSAVGGSAIPSASGVGSSVPAQFSMQGAIDGGYTGTGGGSAMGGAAVAVPAAVVAGVLINSMRTMDKKKKEGTLSHDQINKIWDPVSTYAYDKIPGLSPLKSVDLGRWAQNKIWGDDKYLSEWKRAQHLREKGIDWNWTKDKQAHGLSKQELIDRAKKNNGNVKFAETRDEKYLTPDEIAGFATFGEKFGADWVDKYNTQQRRDIAQKVLNAGAAREHKGTIDVDWNKKGLQQEIDNYLKGIKGGTKK